VVRVTTRPFVPSPREPAPEAGGGKIAVDAPIAAPVPPPRSIWAIVLPIGLVVGVVGFIVAMYVSGQRSLANGFVIFPLIMLMSMGGMLFRGRGAAQRMPWSQLEQYRREYFARLDEVRDEVATAAQRQWTHRAHSHWPPAQLISVAGSPRMWERRPGDPEFGVVRLGTGNVSLAMTIEKPQIPAASKIEPATGHALRKFLLEQRFVRNMARVVWLERQPGLSLVGDLDADERLREEHDGHDGRERSREEHAVSVRGVARSIICQLCAFHSPADLQIMVVSSAPSRWDWMKWLPHCQYPSSRDGCGERRLLFSSPAELETFAGDELLDRKEWMPPPSGLHGGPDPSAPPLWLIVDDNCGTSEDWAALTGKRGVGRVCFLRLASQPDVGIGFDRDNSYRLSGGVLLKQVGVHR
jgi:S-DNA-T family DNA segregation ATPase FtsK/SpoIIIE